MLLCYRATVRHISGCRRRLLSHDMPPNTLHPVFTPINNDELSSLEDDGDDCQKVLKIKACISKTDDHANEQNSTEVDEGFQPKESGGIFPDMSSEQTKDEARMGVGNDHTIDDQDQEQAVATDELDLDSVNFKVDGSHIGVNEVGSELVGNLKALEDPTREEASQSLHAKGECKAL
ncbi:hypothetical protein L1987_03862 [Smallanthus sonchifolius]|uniref:Uncharacterized protein n=1 Tax=Smallanthus sonchifolius TaxID=185202 RepID=A0ACB9KBZ2_9ASTR|nr:hypothetical protein L1987_03862 [Smallanthus sonchifolius]